MTPRNLTSTPKNARAGFTLVEVLIVVMIMGILAAAVIPRVSSSAHDAREEALNFNEHELQKLLKVYMLQHDGAAPTVVKASLPQLLSATNASGTIGASGPDYPFGPYAQGGKMPMNTVVESNTVLSVAKFPPAVKGGSAGWLYHEPTGQIMANRNGALAEVEAVMPISP